MSGHAFRPRRVTTAEAGASARCATSGAKIDGCTPTSWRTCSAGARRSVQSSRPGWAVLLAAGQRWSALVDSPADLRELTVTTFLETGQPLDPAVRDRMERVPEELRAVVAAYDQLPKLQRAVLMLSYLEGVTNAEIAGIVDRSLLEYART